MRGHDVAGAPALLPEAYEVHEDRCGKYGRHITLRGGSLLSAQWAVYDLLDQLGVRYFHPEQTYYPPALT